MDVAYEKFRRAVFGWDRMLLNAAGHDVFNENYKKNWRTYALYIIILLMEICIVYTLIYYDNFIKINCLFYLSLSLQVYCKELRFNYLRYSLIFFSFLPRCRLHSSCTMHAILWIFVD